MPYWDGFDIFSIKELINLEFIKKEKIKKEKTPTWAQPRSLARGRSQGLTRDCLQSWEAPCGRERRPATARPLATSHEVMGSREASRPCTDIRAVPVGEQNKIFRLCQPVHHDILNHGDYYDNIKSWMAKLIPKGNIKKQGKEKGMRKIERKQR